MDHAIGRAGGLEMELQAVLDRQRQAFNAAPSPSATQRRDMLRRLEALISGNQAAIGDALSADFGNRSRMETATAEIMPVLAACAHARSALGRWMRPSRRAVEMTFLPSANRVEYRPVGVVGIVAPWNYPVFLTLGPLVDVLAAGNRAMIKPSELTPATSELLARLIGETYAPECVTVITGDAEVARAFTGLPFDHLLFTGSTHVGREVMRAAADNLVPVTLELGGKSPVIVAGDYDPRQAGLSVAVGKFFNAGQTCTAPDYALLPPDKAEVFAHAVLAAAEAMYPALAANPDYTAIISDRHHQRLTELVSEAEAAGATVLRHPGAQGNARLFPPTVVLDPPLDGRLMRDEIFGPILAVVRAATVEDAIEFVNRRPRPLALYIYTHAAPTERLVLDRTLSGGVAVNTTVVQAAQTDLPFGGIGPSGMGAYHGHEGFLRLSHARAIHRKRGFSAFEFLRPPHKAMAKMGLRARGIQS
jgi:coniferyl-aldehyde dehydrogenase